MKGIGKMARGSGKESIIMGTRITFITEIGLIISNREEGYIKV